MADVKIGKQSGEREQQPQQRAVQRKPESYPSVWTMTPRELFSTSPFSLMRRLTEDMDRMFSSSFNNQRSESAVWMPPIEVRQEGGNLKICAELPGVNKEDVKVEISDHSLVIQGQRKDEHEEKREGYYHSERSYGSFYRTVPLPEEAKIDNAQAEFKNGILEVTVPVPESASKARQIPISAEGENKKSQAA